MNRIKRLIFIIITIVILSACTSKINKANFDRIQAGMTFDEVTFILGTPTSSSSIKIGDIMVTSARWGNRNGLIIIQFFNGVAKIKEYIEGVSTPRRERRSE